MMQRIKNPGVVNHSIKIKGYALKCSTPPKHSHLVFTQPSQSLKNNDIKYCAFPQYTDNSVNVVDRRKLIKKGT